MDEDFDVIAQVAILNANFIALICAAVILHRRQQRGGRRRYWVRPVNRTRGQRGHFFTLFQEMKRGDPEQFFVYTRMTMAQFNNLLHLVHPFIKKRSHRAVSSEERLVITLKYLAQGTSMQSLMWEFCLGKSTISQIIKGTCNAIWDALMPTYLASPTKDKFTEIAEGFNCRWNYPHCLGAIDGKHVIIQCPQMGGTQYYSYKKQHSIILMAACDGNCRFTFVDIGGYGSQGDLPIFRASAFGQAILNDELDIPNPAMLPNNEDIVPYHFLADEAFPLRLNIMRPYPGRFLNNTKRIFNYRLSRARRTIENAFGILSSRWRIFRAPILANVGTVDAIVKATVCLHNFLKHEEMIIPENNRRYCPPHYQDEEDAEGNIILGQWRADNEHNGLQNLGRVGTNNPPNNAGQLRDTLANFFVSPLGEIDWQYRHVNAGGNMHH